ncbi:MAG: FAD binding domain-containing protein [Planctomycetota bacterium]|jgi:carbon-monoxide dehydrogenase medium subunit
MHQFLRPFNYYEPNTVKEALDILSAYRSEAKVLAGGTDLLVAMKRGEISPSHIINMQTIPNLDSVLQNDNDGLMIGALVTCADIADSPMVKDDYGLLATACSKVGSPLIRNMATVGGNLCNASPSADSAPPLLVLEANLILQGPKGQRKVPIDDFFKKPGETCMQQSEILTQIIISKQIKHTGTAFLKMGRAAHDIAFVNAAALLVMEENKCQKCRLAVGAVAPVPLRLKNVEKVVEGEKISQDLLEHVGEMVEQEVNPITDLRSTEEYRRIISGVLIKRAIQHALKNIGLG